MRGEHPAVAGDNAVLFVDQHRVGEAKFADRGSDLCHLFGGMSAGIASGQLDQTACLVLDVQMPGLNGLELQRLLVAGGHQIPIIFITAFTDESTRVQALEAGAIGYLIKPFEEADLLGYIHRALHQRETAPRPRPPPQ
jgi:FixJ family two-component response regulator